MNKIKKKEEKATKTALNTCIDKSATDQNGRAKQYEPQTPIHLINK